MIETIVLDEPKLLSTIRMHREALGMQDINVDLLYAQVGGLDVELAEKARRQLLVKWELTPEQDARKAETVNIMGQLELYPEQARTKLVQNISDIQLTENCNGNCYFCPNGKDKGVSAKYSFESLITFFKTYGEVLPEKISLYWQSDPFDYHDDIHSFVDVYAVYREIRPDHYQYISTALPKGSAEDFIRFIKYLVKEGTGSVEEGRQANTQVRLSVGHHNIQRVEAILRQLIDSLTEDGYSTEQINRKFEKYLLLETRFNDEVYKIGPLISKRDDLLTSESIACEDAVVITPKSVYASIITSPTIYDPMGESRIPITSQNYMSVLPRYLHKERYNKGSGYLMGKIQSPFLPKLTTVDNMPLLLPDAIDNLVV